MTKLANQINCKWHNIVKFEIDILMVIYPKRTEGRRDVRIDPNYIEALLLNS